MAFKQIVVASDFSEGADLAFATALELARLGRARLSVVHVIPPLVAPSPLLDDMMVSEVNLRLAGNLSETSLAEMERRYLSQAKDVQTQALVREGDPVREVIDLTRELKADLLVVGSTGLSGLAEAFFGSVAAKAVRRAPCSVMVARPQPGA
ncbi:MAG: universal stress protein [Thermodesulfobacteriota bacterium]